MNAQTMDFRLHLTLLYDFYGELLTDKQKMIYEMYYQNDLSLTEIGEELGISRQAVRDQLKRTEAILQSYESKLCLLERFLEQQEAVRTMKAILETMEHTKQKLPESFIQNIEKVKEIANEMLK